MYFFKKTSISANADLKYLLLGIVICGLIFYPINYSFAENAFKTVLQQLKDGVASEKITCPNGLRLVLKATDGSPACVTVKTKQKLVQREWAEMEGFGAIVETSPADDVTYAPGVSGAALRLSGIGYIEDIARPNNEFSKLSITAWVKPDYSSGSPQFTIVSKSGAFILGINNSVPPARSVFFSVFNGVQWSTIESQVAIPEEWTHIAATFDGSRVRLYVNGVTDSMQDIPGIQTVSENGQLEESESIIKSDSNIVIGAYMENTRPTSPIEPKNNYSGLIDVLNVYDTLLDPSQVLDIYSQSSDVKPLLSWQFGS